MNATLQLGDRRVAGLQRLLWPDRMAASLGELSAGAQHGAAAALGAQQPLRGRPSRWEASLQPLAVPVFMESWALDSGTTGSAHTQS